MRIDSQNFETFRSKYTKFYFDKAPSNEVKVSVILPIYNQEKYLENALKSLQNQTLKDAEYICVNDGSNDNSLNILKKYAEKDSRIKIINHNKNYGCGYARNNGLKNAIGKYIAFLDPDDTMDENTLELLYKKSEKQNCDMVVFDFNKIDERGNILSRYNLQKRLQRYFKIDENSCFSWKDIKPKIFGGIFPAAWNKFYKRDLITKNRLHFAKCNLTEDNVFVFGATLNAKRIGYLGQSLYNYVIHENSAIRSCNDKNLCIFRSLDCVKKLLENLKLTEELKIEFDNYVTRIVSFHARQIKSQEKFRKICEKKLSPKQNAVLREKLSANKMLLPLMDMLIKCK